MDENQFWLVIFDGYLKRNFISQFKKALIIRIVIIIVIVIIAIIIVIIIIIDLG